MNINGLIMSKLLELDGQTLVLVLSNYYDLRDKLLKRKGYITVAECKSILIDELEAVGMDTHTILFHNKITYDMNSEYGFVDLDAINEWRE